MPHINEKLDWTVEVFIVHAGKVLLRLHDKYGIWLSIGGHIERDEDSEEAALREIHEEVGLNVVLVGKKGFDSPNQGRDYRDRILPEGINRHRINDTHDHVSLIYYGRSDSDAVKPEKATDVWKWCTKEEVDKLDGIKPEVAFHAKRAIELLS